MGNSLFFESLCIVYNLRQNIRRLFNILTLFNILFSTKETKLDYYRQKI